MGILTDAPAPQAERATCSRGRMTAFCYQWHGKAQSITATFMDSIRSTSPAKYQVCTSTPHLV